MTERNRQALIQHIPAIQALCEELGVTRLQVYEPDLTDSAGNKAPFGFIVTIPDTGNPGLWAGKLVELEEGLSSMFGREVDLLLPGALRNDWVRTNLASRRFEVYSTFRSSDAS